MKSKRKQGKGKNADRDDNFDTTYVSSAAVRGVCAIFFVAIAGFLVLAQLGGGGTIGATFYSWLSWLLGIGYFLLPISLILLAFLIFRSFKRQFGWVQFSSMTVFLLAGLSLINLAFPGEGGILGISVSRLIVAGVDTTAAVIFLIAFVIASLVVAFDVHLGMFFASVRDYVRTLRANEESTDVVGVPIVGLPENTEPLETPMGERAEMTEPPQNPKDTSPGPITQLFRGGETPPEGFPIIAATGSTYTPPPISILAKNKGKPEVGDVKANMNIIKRTLQNFGIQVEMDEASIGPTVTRYAMKPAEGVRLSKIVALQSNIELAVQASPIRIEAPIPGKALVGIEVPNSTRTTLGLAPLVSDEAYIHSDKPLLVALGRSITGTAHFADLARMPHMLVAGATGAGKSIMIHDFVVSLLYRCGPERLRFIMIDPKRVELTVYNSIPHLLTPVITDAKKAILVMKWLAKEMERRYNILEAEAVRDISSYHQNVVAPSVASPSRKASDEHSKASAGKPASTRKNGEPVEAMPYIVVVIDELADIMSMYPRELESGIVRLAQMSRAVGIHLILSTQRPSVKVITGLIKANIPARVALQVASQIDSRTILDTGGAEKLLGAGDMLFLSGEMSKPRRIQAPFISEDEVKKVVAHILKMSEGTLPSEIDLSDSRAMSGTDPIFSASLEDEDEDDALYAEARQTVIEAGKASTSYLQRKLGVGYARAARLMDILEERGVIGAADGAKPRNIIDAGNADELARAGSEEDPSEENLN